MPQPTATATPNDGYSANERLLYDIATVHIVANIDGSGGPSCKPLRQNLPAGALAGVECIGDAGIDTGDYYLYPSADPALEAHKATLAAHQIELGSGDCETGVPGDSAWWVPDGFTDETSPWRAGCFTAGDDDLTSLSLVCHSGTPSAPSPVLYISLTSFDTIEDTYEYALASYGPGHPPRICDVFDQGEFTLLNGYFGLGDCSPIESDLPRRAFEAIECVVDDPLVDRVGMYLFESPVAARTQYVARMSQYDIPLESGDCGNGVAGDSAWGDLKWGDAGGGPSDSYWRSGCFINENGHANVRLTCDANGPDPLVEQGVYVGVLGKTNDLGKLFDWAWGDADWREYVKDLYEEHPNDSGLGVQPGICTSGWFEP